MSQKTKKTQPKRAREFSPEFKRQAEKRALGGESITALAEELGIRRKLIYAWKDRLQELGEAGLARKGGRPPAAGRGELLAARRRIAELERKAGQQTLELDFLSEALRRVEADGKQSV